MISQSIRPLSKTTTEITAKKEQWISEKTKVREIESSAVLDFTESVRGRFGMKQRFGVQEIQYLGMHLLVAQTDLYDYFCNVRSKDIGCIGDYRHKGNEKLLTFMESV